MKKGIIFIILFLLFISPASADELISAKLEKCVDGDTAYFKINNKKVKYRFLAINTPEKNEDYGELASKVTCEMLTNAKKIEIEVDPKASKTDKYGRSLGWIYVDGVLLQKYLIENGYDITYGARPLKRLLSRTVETTIAKVLINGELKFGSTLVVDYKNDKFDVTIKDN